MIVSTLANCYRDSQKHSEPFQPWDFFPTLNTLKPQTTDEQITSSWEVFFPKGQQ